jgi:hypothetical protein
MKLPSDQVSALAALGFAANETNALRRIFLSQSHDYTGEEVIDAASSIQRLVILRTWSSKLFEAEEFLKSLCGKKPLTQDKLLIGLALEALSDLKGSTNVEGAQVAQDVRNESSNHYPFGAAKKNLSHVHKDALCNIYLHKHGGNDFFPFGEAVMFHGRLHRRWKSDASFEVRKIKFDNWIRWCLEANDALARTHAKFVNAILFAALGRNTLYQKTYYVPESLVGHPLERLTPVFFRKDENL